jgi:hypothetical protein
MASPGVSTISARTIDSRTLVAPSSTAVALHPLLALVLVDTPLTFNPGPTTTTARRYSASTRRIPSSHSRLCLVCLLPVPAHPLQQSSYAASMTDEDSGSCRTHRTRLQVRVPSTHLTLSIVSRSFRLILCRLSSILLSSDAARRVSLLLISNVW